jgi:hypothetical protein
MQTADILDLHGLQDGEQETAVIAASRTEFARMGDGTHAREDRVRDDAEASGLLATSTENGNLERPRVPAARMPVTVSSSGRQHGPPSTMPPGLYELLCNIAGH